MEVRCGADRQSQSLINLVTVFTYQFIQCQDKAFQIQHWIRLWFVQNVWVHSRDREKNEFLVWMRHSAGAWMRPRDIIGECNTLVNTLSFLCASLCVRQLFSEHLLLQPLPGSGFAQCELDRWCFHCLSSISPPSCHWTIVSNLYDCVNVRVHQGSELSYIGPTW